MMALPWQNKLWDPDNAQQGLSALWMEFARPHLHAGAVGLRSDDAATALGQS